MNKITKIKNLQFKLRHQFHKTRLSVDVPFMLSVEDYDIIEHALIDMVSLETELDRLRKEATE